ncbi:MAG: glycosyltransferase family 2 protein [Mycobacterium sp.]|nr:glycosyltransferase family 2 protein [Mycobacterium sp.]
MSVWPSVEVIIPTRDRPELLTRAVDAARRQEYPGPLRVAVVFDRADPDRSLEVDGQVPVRVITNSRTPGLAGARNSGIVTSGADLVAFCDDDDEWLPGKLRRQVERVQREPDAQFITTSIRIDFHDRQSPRYAGTETVTHEQLLVSRMAMLHSSTFLVWRRYLTDEIGLVNEDSPSSQNEDWELLLRASQDRPIAHVDEALVAVRWGSASLFSRAWESKILGAEWILECFPEIRRSRIGYARVLGQIAFAHAALAQRRQAVRWAVRSQRTRPREPRGYLALAVALGFVPARLVLERLHRHGRGV